MIWLSSKNTIFNRFGNSGREEEEEEEEGTDGDEKCRYIWKKKWRKKRKIYNYQHIFASSNIKKQTRNNAIPHYHKMKKEKKRRRQE